ncbi:hypothetical protein VHUM_02178 [Vanrija humicola]|uniref:RRM domain-containing protein n=1 Tax=Vanrija humicola TaxID=5417 RepID=A0A7D8V1Z9_VANHU|nr:hypothetical protein VHUM_02178 [Vanrija humicola]
MTPAPSTTNGGSSQHGQQSTNTPSTRVILPGNGSRILCVADIRGDYHELNRLIREHEATAVIHTGDFGFLNADSLERMGDKILRHLLQYSPLIPPATRNQLLGITAGRSALISQLNSSSIHFPLSQFPHLLSGAITFPVPVYTVWGLIEDVRIVEKFRTGEYEVHNLTVIDEANSPLIETAGLKLRLFGLGGAVALHKMSYAGEGFATIAGGQGTMWTTALQLGELVDTAQRLYDQTETRLLITSAPVSRTGLLSLLALAIRADLTISGGLHFRYPASLNDFAVYGDFDSYRHKLVQARDSFISVYDVVKDRVEGSLNETQRILLKKVLAMVQRIPTNDDNSWQNTWHWVLADALCGHLLLSITDGRVSAETRSNGLNFAHRANQAPQAPAAPIAPPVVPLAQPPRSTAAETSKSTPASVPNKPVASASAPKLPAKASSPAGPAASLAKGAPIPAPVKPEHLPRSQRGSGSAAAPTTVPAASTKPDVKPNSKGRESPVPAKSNKGTPQVTSAALPKDGKRGANGEKGDGEETEAPKTGPQTPKRFSLYLKGLPNPTSEAEIRAFFGPESEKITAVKLVYDQTRRQKNFCYVDFANETDLQETLKAHPSGSIRETPITVEMSNPPVRNLNADRGARASRGGRGGRPTRGGSSSSKDAVRQDGAKPSDTPKSDTPKPEAKSNDK